MYAFKIITLFSQLIRPQSSNPLDRLALLIYIFAVINVCVNGSDAYVQLTICFSRLWSQLGDLLTLYIVCGGANLIRGIKSGLRGSYFRKKFNSRVIAN